MTDGNDNGLHLLMDDTAVPYDPETYVMSDEEKMFCVRLAGKNGWKFVPGSELDRFVKEMHRKGYYW